MPHVTTPQSPYGQQNMIPPPPQAHRPAAPGQAAYDRAGYPQQQYGPQAHVRHGQQAPQQPYAPSSPRTPGPQGPGWQAGPGPSFGPGRPQAAGQSGPQRVPGHTGPQQPVRENTGPQQPAVTAAQQSPAYAPGVIAGTGGTRPPMAGSAHSHRSRDAREIPPQPTYGRPADLPPYTGAVAPRAPRNGFGTTALVLGIVGALFAFIPIIGMIAWPLVILGLIFGLLGIARARSGTADNRGVAISGTVLSAVGLVICIVWASAFSAAVSSTTPPGSAGAGAPAVTTPAVTAPIPEQPAAPAAAAPVDTAGGDVITYEVTGSGTAGTVTYVKDTNMGMEQVNGTDLPWRKEVTFDDGGAFSFQPLSLVAQSGSGGNKEITCRILRNGQEVTSSTSSGPYAVVTCSGS